MIRPHHRSDVYELVAGRQLQILRSLGIEWNPQRSRHVRCPYPDHTDANPSWRWDHDRGMAHCTCGHTDIFGVVMRVKNLGTGREAWQAAADYCRAALGETPGRDDAKPARPAGYDPDRYLRVLLRSGPGEGTFADLYLRSRGIALSPWPDALRFNASTYCKETNNHLPAVIALMGAAPDAEPTAVLRIYLSLDGKAKAAITEPKLLLGRPLTGKCVWLGEPGERVIITEGVEDACACLIAGETFAAAGIGDNTANIVPPPGVREVVIFADRDADDKGMRIAKKLAERLHTEGRRVLIALAPEPYKDANELLIKQGANAVERAIEAAAAYLPKASTALEWWREETVSGDDLQTMTFPPLRFVLPGLVPEGLCLLAGKPKAKKSWLALDVAIAATADRFTLGEIKPDQGDVLYLALEDLLRRVQRRMTKLLGMQKWPSRLLIKTTWKRVDQGGLDGIAAWAKSVERPTMVVVDTLERVRPMPSPSSKATPYSLDYAALAGLQHIATELQIAVIVVTHVRKATADDVFDTISGTLGLTAAADTILVLGPKNGVMSLCVRGRDVEEAEKAIQWNQHTCRWTITGDTPHDAPKSDAGGRILAALVAAARPMSIEEIMKAAGFKNRHAADQMLSRMFKGMEISRPERGMYEAKTEGPVRNV